MFDPRKGRIVTNFETLGAVTTKSFTVPLNMRWLVLFGRAERDVSATLDIDVYDASDQLILKMNAVSAATGDVHWTNRANNVALWCPVLLETGMYVKYTWGVAQTTPEVSCVVLEYDI